MLKTLTFFTEVPAKQKRSVVSELLDFPYLIKEARVRFYLNVRGNLRVKILVSFDNVIPDNAEPAGFNVMKYGNVDYIIGDNETVPIYIAFPVKREGSYIKVFGYNLDSFPHKLDVKIDLDIPDERIMSGGL